MNELWDIRTQGLAVEAQTSATERALLIVGVVLWGLSLAFYAVLLLFFLAAGPLPDVV